jgi:hypothetical protein
MADAETRFAELKRYVEFSAEDAALLARVPWRPPRRTSSASPRSSTTASASTRRRTPCSPGEAQIARLQRSLVRWLERVFGGDYDEAYFAETTAIGRVHVKVGLPQRYMFTAMALIRCR